MTTKEKEIFTTEEAAEMMGCSPSTIEEHARNRVLPGLRMGHEWRFRCDGCWPESRATAQSRTNSQSALALPSPAASPTKQAIHQAEALARMRWCRLGRSWTPWRAPGSRGRGPARQASRAGLCRPWLGSRAPGSGLGSMLCISRLATFWYCTSGCWAFAPKGVAQDVECTVHLHVEALVQLGQFTHGTLNRRVQHGRRV